MAIDNLNYYSAWLPAGQLTDRYSSQPWCLRSKNLDIFSSSKSVKATAFSNPTARESDVISEEWGLVLKTDGKVYERVNGVDTLFIDPADNFPVYQVCYSWWSGGTYENAQRWTPQSMTVATEWWEWKSFVVFTDRASFTYSKVKYVLNKTFKTVSNLSYDEYSHYANGYLFTKTNASFSNATIRINLEKAPLAKIPLKIRAEQYNTSDTDITLDSVKVYYNKYYYDWEMDGMVGTLDTYREISYSGDIKDAGGVVLNLDIDSCTDSRQIDLSFKFTRHTGITSWYAWGWNLFIDMNAWPSENHRFTDWDYNYYYSYLPIRDRKLEEVWEYYWMKWDTFQTLYEWESTWVNVNWDKQTRYDLVQYMWWANDPDMEVISLLTWNEQVYMIGNLKGNWYIIPCDLTWGRGTPYIAYGCEFKWATNIDYLMYLVWEDRGISELWVYNWQELVSLLWGKEENQTKNLIKNEEQYRFDWKITNWRKNLILSTKDNRIFQYWQTHGGKWWTFIHELPSEASIIWLKANWNDLEISYSITQWQITTNYAIKYQDDTPYKNYNTEWMAEYPIILWNHLLEKEESDLFVSYILPSADTSLEFWGMANHYHFWTFTSEDDYTFDSELSYKMKWATWDYELKFIEKNENQYTFKLEWDLPIQTTNDMQIIDSEWVVLINYSEYNHFRKIWEITTTEYQEWEFRFHNLNNKLELPKSHSLQIMVIWKGTANYTPELFALDLVANQRERW